MSFEELVSQLKKLPLEELRKEYDGYFEFVVSGEHVQKLYPVLEKYFGVPFKPPGIEPDPKVEDVAKDLGGVRKQQTLYHVQTNGLSHCAMIWPWNDGSRVTVKLARGAVQIHP